MGLSTTVRITLKDGTYREDIGYGSIDNSKSRGAAFEKVKKESITDAIKRALKNFGYVLGGCMYDKVSECFFHLKTTSISGLHQEDQVGES